MFRNLPELLLSMSPVRDTLPSLWTDDYVKHPSVREWARNAPSATLEHGVPGVSSRNGVNIQEELDRLYLQYRKIVHSINDLETQRTMLAVAHAPIRNIPNEILVAVFCWLPHTLSDEIMMRFQ